MIPDQHCGNPQDHPDHQWFTTVKDEQTGVPYRAAYYCSGNPAELPKEK